MRTAEEWNEEWKYKHVSRYNTMKLIMAVQRDALEAAAKVCEAEIDDDWKPCNMPDEVRLTNAICQNMVDSIRALLPADQRKGEM